MTDDVFRRSRLCLDKFHRRYFFSFFL